MKIPEAQILALALRMNTNPQEIEERWSIRWVNLLMFFLEAQGQAQQLPTDKSLK